MMVLKMISFNLHTEFSNAVTYLEIDSKFKDIYSFTAAFILDGYTPTAYDNDASPAWSMSDEDYVRFVLQRK